MTPLFQVFGDYKTLPKATVLAAKPRLSVA
jgi:hypothetical protein